MKLILVVAVSLCCCCTSQWLVGAEDQPAAAGADDVPVGHKMKLGSHRPMEGRVETLDVLPHPIEFYEQYSVGSKPAIFKGAAKDMPAFKLWTDKYMKEHYSGEVVAVEPGKKENRTRVALEGSQMGFGEFLDKYNTSDVYMVDSVPNSMKAEYMMLKPILCGGFTNFFSMSNMWFSSGGTKSVLHNDDADNINCVLSGSKEFFMAHKDYETQLPFSPAGHVEMDVDAVDLIKIPEMKPVKWWLAEVEAGDCLFIPHYWLHQVRSTGRNLAVNIWWHFFRNFNYTDCMTKEVGDDGEKTRKELPQYASFSSFSMHEGESHRKMFVEMLYPWGAKKPKKMNKKSFIKAVTTGFAEGERPTRAEFEELKDAAVELFDLGNKNGDKYLDLEELYSIDANLFVELFGEPKGGYSIETLTGESEGDDRRAAADDLEEVEDDDGGDEAEADGDSLDIVLDDGLSQEGQPRDEL